VFFPHGPELRPGESVCASSRSSPSAPVPRRISDDSLGVVELSMIFVATGVAFAPVMVSARQRFRQAAIRRGPCLRKRTTGLRDVDLPNTQHSTPQRYFIMIRTALACALLLAPAALHAQQQRFSTYATVDVTDWGVQEKWQF
jgi:hypothetical protein